jgi:serine phosphatase RsbU (regulator of sigma subunit)
LCDINAEKSHLSLRVATTPEGNVLLTAMDVEGHGVSAAKKAVSVDAALDEILPQTRSKNANDILSMIDKKLDTKDELSITAGLMTYDPVTHALQTATASSEFAFVVRANGAVRQLDAEGGGLGLGSDMYTSFPRGNEGFIIFRRP